MEAWSLFCKYLLKYIRMLLNKRINSLEIKTRVCKLHVLSLSIFHKYFKTKERRWKLFSYMMKSVVAAFTVNLFYIQERAKQTAHLPPPPVHRAFQFENRCTWPNYVEMYSRIIPILPYLNEVEIGGALLSKIHQMALDVV